MDEKPSASEPSTRTAEPRRRKRALVVHPFLLIAWFVLVVYAANLKEGVPLGDLLRPLGLSLVSGAVVLGVIWLIFRRNLLKAALLTSVLVFLFFNYGRVYNAVAGRRLGDVMWGRHLFLLILWGALAVGATMAVVRARSPIRLTRGLNVIAAGLVVFNLASIGVYKFQTRGGPAIAGNVLNFKGGTGATANRPDIYYIMLEEYGGERALRELLGFDNRPFLDALRRRGFYVPEHATTNYPHTEHSLASSLNLQYLQRMIPSTPSADGSVVQALIQNDQVPKILHSKGYKYIHIGSRFTPTATNPQADVNIKMQGALSEFASTVVDTTVLDAGNALNSARFNFQRREYVRALFQFDQLAKTKMIQGPKFVFTHILIPHYPYIFDQTGHFVDPSERSRRTNVQNYIGQLQYANKRVLQTIDTLLSGPERTRPVIILQSDEGPYTGLHYGEHASDRELEQHFGILEAYYLPHVDKSGLYPYITPINSFRLVFNKYFGAGLPLLPDRNYVFLNPRHLYTFIDVTARVRQLS
jgi:hypothetical protein